MEGEGLSPVVRQATRNVNANKNLALESINGCKAESKEPPKGKPSWPKGNVDSFQIVTNGT
jgi:hypothetical protein